MAAEAHDPNANLNVVKLLLDVLNGSRAALENGEPHETFHPLHEFALAGLTDAAKSMGLSR